MQGRERVEQMCLGSYSPEMLASTDKKALRNFWKSELKMIFGWDKCKRVNMKYKKKCKGGWVKYKTMPARGGAVRQAQGERGARVSLCVPFALMACVESGKKIFIMVFQLPAGLRRDCFS